MVRQATQQRPTSRLPNVMKSMRRAPLRAFLYGDEGVGKTRLAAHADEPIFFDLESGSDHVFTSRYPFNGGKPSTMQDVRDAVNDLLHTEHSYKSLVIDTVDALEPLIWDELVGRYSGVRCAMNKTGRKLDRIEDFAFQSGYKAAVDEWRKFVEHLDQLRKKREMNILLIGHAVIRTFKNPVGEDYDRWNPRIHDKAAGFLKEWSDVVGFCAYEEGSAKLDDDAPRAKGYSTGRRMLYVRRTAAYDAKSRIPLPDELEMKLDNPWAPFARAIEEAYSMTPKQLSELIQQECARLNDDDLTTNVLAAVDSARGDTAKLMNYLHELKKRNAAPKEEADNGK